MQSAISTSPQYLKEIRRAPMLEAEEEYLLAKSWRNHGDRDAANMAVAFSAARKDRLDMSVSIALGSATQIALFVAPVLVLLSYVIGPKPMDLQFWPGAVTMVMISAVTACFITNSGRSAWFIGALLVLIYAIFAMTLYILPPGA